MDNAETLHIAYQELKEITGFFSDECLLGCGTFGKVYKVCVVLYFGLQDKILLPCNQKGTCLLIKKKYPLGEK